MAIAHPILPGVRFKDAVGFPGYCVGDDGSVWSHRKGGLWKRLNPYVSNQHGHLMVDLYAGSKRYRMLVHRLVLLIFVGPCPDGMEACHFPDRDPSNNRLMNLRWDTGPANSQDAIAHSTKSVGVMSPNAKIDDDIVREMRRKFEGGCPIRFLSRQFGLCRKTVKSIIKRQGWKHVM
jgi:hypothetical protein